MFFESSNFIPTAKNVAVGKGAANNLFLVIFQVIMTKISDKLVHLPKELVSAHDAERATVKAEPAGPSELTTG